MGNILQAAGDGLFELLQPFPLLAVVIGSLVGIVSGALPGVTLPGMVVLISLAYGMDPAFAIPLAVGMAATVHTSDTLPSVVFGIPGSSSSQATIMDGYPLAQQGRAGEALSAGYFASMIGGFFGALVIVITLPAARWIILQFRAPELLAITVLGICMVGVLAAGAMVKGLLGAALGLSLSTIGLDRVIGQARYTFGSVYLFDGIGFILVIIGLFAVPELVGLIIGNRSVSKLDISDLGTSVRAGRSLGVAAVMRNKGLVLRSSGFGALAGTIPGIGQATVDWLTYVQAKVTVRGGYETFGTGDIRGVIAPESANNATAAATYIPAMVIGVPVGLSAALVIGLLITLGIQPGPMMLSSHLDLVFLVVFSLIISNTLGTIIMMFSSPLVARITFVRAHVLVPIILAILLVAAIQVRGSYWDLFTLFGFSVLGWHMKRYGWARPPVIIGVLLGPLIELYLTQSLRAFGVTGILQRPMVWVIVALAMVIGFMATRARKV